MARMRPPEGMLLPEDDPRVQAAWRAMQHLGLPSFGDGSDVDTRDAAEVVNAVLDADDRMAED